MVLARAGVLGGKTGTKSVLVNTYLLYALISRVI